jgi:transposase
VRCGHELWIGDAAAIARQEGRKQKHDRRAAKLILKLMVENRFPKIWVPTVAERDLRQLLMHRHHLVRMRTRVKNQLQHIALNQGVQKKYKLWTQAGLKVLRAAGTGVGTLDAAAARHAAADAGRVGAEDPTAGASGGA